VENEDLCVDLKRAIDKSFVEINVAKEDIQSAIEKMIIRSQVRAQGSPLIRHFLRAAKENEMHSLSEVFYIFLSEADKFARMIVSDFFMEQSKRIISEVSIGGIAGGKKFIAGYDQSLSWLPINRVLY